MVMQAPTVANPSVEKSSVEKSSVPDILLDTWTPIAWDDFLRLVDRPEHEKNKAYYHNDRMRLELMSTGFTHSINHSVLILLIGLYAILKGISMTSCDNCSFRKTGIAEFQPDIAYYIGDRANLVPDGTRVVDLNVHPLPDLVIEVSDTSIADDKGDKRLLYEDLGIQEYWIWDVQHCQIIAFAIGDDRSSRRIKQSLVFPGLSFDILEEALCRSKETNQSIAGTWLMQQLQS